MAEVIDYASPGPLTSLYGVDPLALESVAADPVGVCPPVHSPVMHPLHAPESNLPADRFDDNHVQPKAAP